MRLVSRNEFDIFHNTGARMLDSTNHNIETVLLSTQNMQ